MGLLDKVKQMFMGPELPPETRQAFERAASYRDLLEALDRVLTANEVKLREVEREIEKLSMVEESEIDRLKEPGLNDRQKKLVLQRIQRLRKQIKLFDDKIDIHTKNIELHQTLIGKIQRIESMAMQAVDEELITEVVTDFEEQFEKYKNVLHAGTAADIDSSSPLTAKDRLELRELEEELLGKKLSAKTDAELKSLGRDGKTSEAASKDTEAEKPQAQTIEQAPRSKQHEVREGEVELE